MGAEIGVSKDTVQHVWSVLGINPHLEDTFKVSTDPDFSEKLIDVVSLYLTPPENAIELCMVEKSSIKASDRTQPSLPMCVNGRIQGCITTNAMGRLSSPRLRSSRARASGSVFPRMGTRSSYCGSC